MSRPQQQQKFYEMAHLSERICAFAGMTPNHWQISGKLALMREGGDPPNRLFHTAKWIPAFAGMTATDLLRTLHSIFSHALSRERRCGTPPFHDGVRTG